MMFLVVYKSMFTKVTLDKVSKSRYDISYKKCREKEEYFYTAIREGDPPAERSSGKG